MTTDQLSGQFFAILAMFYSVVVGSTTVGIHRCQHLMLCSCLVLVVFSGLQPWPSAQRRRRTIFLLFVKLMFFLGAPVQLVVPGYWVPIIFLSGGGGNLGHGFFCQVLSQAAVEQSWMWGRCGFFWFGYGSRGMWSSGRRDCHQACGVEAVLFVGWAPGFHIAFVDNCHLQDSGWFPAVHNLLSTGLFSFDGMEVVAFVVGSQGGSSLLWMFALLVSSAILMFYFLLLVLCLGVSQALALLMIMGKLSVSCQTSPVGTFLLWVRIFPFLWLFHLLL